MHNEFLFYRKMHVHNLKKYRKVNFFFNSEFQENDGVVGTVHKVLCAGVRLDLPIQLSSGLA